MWLFFRCSGVGGTEVGGEVAASVGDEVSEPAGMFSGSNSRSGMGGDTKGRRVIRKRARRSSALSRMLVLITFSGRRYALENLKHDDASPPRLTRHLPAETHLKQQFGEPDQFKSASGPFVGRRLVAPCPSIASMRRRGKERLVLGIRVRNLREKSIMVHAHDIEYGRDYTCYDQREVQ